MLQNERQMS